MDATDAGGSGPAAVRAVPTLEAEGLAVSYGSLPVLLNMGLTVPEGSMLAIVGPNGAGKSTLVKAVLDLTPRLSGEVRFFGGTLDDARARIAYVPQRAGVDWDFPARAVDVVLMGLYRELGWLRIAGRRHREKALACLAQVGMADFASRQIGQLSGGQQQRVFLARALAQDADLYLLDEPFAGVDAASEAVLLTLLHGLRAEGRTIVCVHHDLATVMRDFDRVLIVNRTRIAEGPVATAFTAANLRAAYGTGLALPQDIAADRAA